jgi:putative oxidoreductase
MFSNFNLSRISALIVAIVLLQTLYFKFTAHPDSVYIFSTLGMEPWGRIGVGVSELITAVLLLINRTKWLGALLGLGTISGAIFFHLFILGIDVNGDHGKLFFLALIVFFGCLIILWKERKSLPIVGAMLP